MKVAIYPGSFNPWHEGHEEILQRALQIFGKVIVAVGTNPEKSASADEAVKELIARLSYGIKNGCVEVVKFEGLLADYVNGLNELDYKVHAVVRGLRNTQDFEFEKAQLYWNQDLKIGVPTMFFIAGRNTSHISSSAIRAIKAMK